MPSEDPTSSAGRHIQRVYGVPKQLELDLSGSFVGNIDAVPDYQNVAVDVDRLATVTARLSWCSLVLPWACGSCEAWARP